MDKILPDYFNKNMELLKKHHPCIWQEIMDNPPEPAGEIFLTSEGKPNLHLTNKQAKKVIFHSASETQDSAKNIESIPENSTAFIALLGIGLGYSALNIQQNRPQLSTIALFEVHPGIFIQALRHMDLTPLFTDPRVLIALGDKPDIEQIMAPAKRSLMLEDFLSLKHAPSINLYEAQYQKISAELYEHANALNVGGATSVHYAKTFMQNCFRNLNTIHHNYLLDKLKNSFTGIPAILIAGGPSLDRNIQELSQAKDRAVLIAADSALPALLAHGISPDFVTALDPQDIIYEKFANVAPDIQETSLVCSVTVSSKVLKIFPASKTFITCKASPIEIMVNELLGGTLLTGGASTVAHLNFQTATILGCSPIIFVGQDLAFTKLKDHANHVNLTCQDTMNKTLDEKEDLHWVKGAVEESVPTNRSFLSMRIHFEKMIASQSGLFINATEGGVHIEGTEVMPLKDVIAKYCTKKQTIQEVIHGDKSASWQPDTKKLSTKFKAILNKINKMQTAVSKSNKIATSLNKSLRKLQNEDRSYTTLNQLPSRMQKQLQSLDVYHKSLDNEKEIWGLLDTATLEGVRDTDRLRYYADSIKDIPEKYLEWLLNSLKVLKEVNIVRDNTLKFFAENIKSTLNYHKEEQKITAKSKRSPSAQNLLQLIKFYFTHGDFVLLQKNLKKLMPGHLDSAEILFYRGTLAAHHCEYEKADLLFSKAIMADQQFSEKINIFQQHLADEYCIYAANTLIDTTTRRRMLIKGLRYCINHQDALDAIQKFAKEDLEKIQTSIQTSTTEKTSKILHSWIEDLKKHQHLSSCIPHEDIAKFYLRHGNMQTVKKDYTGALTSFLTALEFSPDDPEIFLLLTDTCFSLENFQEGIGFLQKAIQQDKQYGLYWENIGDNLQKTDQYTEAIYAYEQCFVVLPEQLQLLKKIGDCYMATDQPEAAQTAYLQLKEKMLSTG